MWENTHGRAAQWAFDFNRLPSYHHGVQLRQSVILNLHKDVLKYTGEMFENEFNSVRSELARLTEEIKANSETLKEGTPEYEEMMKRKGEIQKRIENHRRRLDVVKTQENLVEVQHTMIRQANQRYQKNETNAKTNRRRTQRSCDSRYGKSPESDFGTGEKERKQPHGHGAPNGDSASYRNQRMIRGEEIFRYIGRNPPASIYESALDLLGLGSGKKSVIRNLPHHPAGVHRSIHEQ